MTEEKQVYRCNICGNIVEVIHIGTGKLVCCDNQMQLLEEKTEGIGSEKHIPIIEQTENGIKVQIGAINHPMEENHCIEWVELVTDNGVFRKVFKPGEKPEAEFDISVEDINQIGAREYCSIHGLWKSK
ncbi:MAG: desulfoferrodoxin [Methanobacterium sp.]